MESEGSISSFGATGQAACGCRTQSLHIRQIANATARQLVRDEIFKRDEMHRNGICCNR